MIIRCLLIEPFPESALNEEAGRLLLENYDEYARHARLMTSIHAAAPRSRRETGQSDAGATAGSSGGSGPLTGSSGANAGGDGGTRKEEGAGSPVKKAKPEPKVTAIAASMKNVKKSMKRL